MRRRTFLTSVAAASALAVPERGRLSAAGAGPQAPADRPVREYYELRRYELRSGPQVKLVNDYFRDAFIPAANRLGIKPVGAFNVVAGATSPSLWVLIPCAALETLVGLNARFASDSEYLARASSFLEAPATSPAYVRMESSLMIAFEGWPRLQAPTGAAEKRPRAFELRTYESPSDRDHERKVEMFNHGEFEIFGQAGFRSVFYGDTLVGKRLPNLTYMLAFNDLAERNKLWAAFGASPQWKQLSSASRYAFEEIVSNITNVILSPADYSQI
ncbi:MAG TPA: NIPSNAP family protein [Terriglobia bacterium]|nr:NIPSNAP family protein [Terriglobia bacterium]